MREAAKPALEKLDELGIKYYYYEHPLAKTMEDCEGIGADVGAKHFKTSTPATIPRPTSLS